MKSFLSSLTTVLLVCTALPTGVFVAGTPNYNIGTVSIHPGFTPRSEFVGSYHLERRQSGAGRITYYGTEGEAAPTLSTPGACGTNYLPPNKDYFVAMNNDQYDVGAHCGKCVEITCAENKCKPGAKSIGYITDLCPSCSHGQLDISIRMFAEIAGSVEKAKELGISNTRWRIVPCPNTYGADSSNSAAKPQEEYEPAKNKEEEKKAQPKKEENNYKEKEKYQQQEEENAPTINENYTPDHQEQYQDSGADYHKPHKCRTY